LEKVDVLDHPAFSIISLIGTKSFLALEDAADLTEWALLMSIILGMLKKF
jgi:hypothetical protein